MFEKAPSLFDFQSLAKCTTQNAAEIDGRYVPARPMGLFGLHSRMRLAWAVFTGEADALIWPAGQ